MSLPDRETVIRAFCQNCRLETILPIPDVIAVVKGDGVQVVWICQACGIGEATFRDPERRAEVLQSGCVVIGVDQLGHPETLATLLGWIPDWPATRPRVASLTKLRQLLRGLRAGVRKEKP